MVPNHGLRRRCLQYVRSREMRKYRSSRCVLNADGRYLLAQHNNYRPETIGKWGLPGGRVDDEESPKATVRREMREEFGMSLLGEIVEIGDWEYRGHWHKVFATSVPNQTLRFDRNEILDAQWYRFNEIEEMERNGELHTGFELEAITMRRNQKIEPGEADNA